MYCAIIGDIVDSKKIVNREETQQKLHSLLRKLSEQYSKHVASNFTITLGDEFQGLLLDTIYLIEIIDEIKMQMYPIEFRFGIGIGDIHTEVNKEIAIGADGPAYHIARACIDEIKEKDNKYEQVKQDIVINSDEESQGLTFKMINAAFAQCFFYEKNWSDKQREVVIRLMKEDVSQRAIAEDLGLTQSSVNRRISQSGFLVYQHLKLSAKNLINELWEALIHE